MSEWDEAARSLKAQRRRVRRAVIGGVAPADGDRAAASRYVARFGWSSLSWPVLVIALMGVPAASEGLHDHGAVMWFDWFRVVVAVVAAAGTAAMYVRAKRYRSRFLS
jgi:hypothetical protein